MFFEQSPIGWISIGWGNGFLLNQQQANITWTMLTLMSAVIWCYQATMS